MKLLNTIGLLALFLSTTAFAQQPAIYKEAPKQGLLGCDLNTELTVEGDLVINGPGAPHLIISKVEGKELPKPVDLPLTFPHSKLHVVLRGFEYAEEHKGIGIQNWKVSGELSYTLAFSFKEAFAPVHLKLEPDKIP
jgi:hypothetical protein